MEIKVLKNEKNVLEVELDNVTVAEVVRVYLNEKGVKLAVWSRDHPTSNPILRIEGDKPKKLLKDSISAVEKDIDSAVNEFKKLK